MFYPLKVVKEIIVIESDYKELHLRFHGSPHLSLNI